VQTEETTIWQLVEQRESNPKKRIDMAGRTKRGARLSRRDFARVAGVTAAMLCHSRVRQPPIRQPRLCLCNTLIGIAGATGF
jgi:hypothetical protein